MHIDKKLAVAFGSAALVLIAGTSVLAATTTTTTATKDSGIAVPTSVTIQADAPVSGATWNAEIAPPQDGASGNVTYRRMPGGQMLFKNGDGRDDFGGGMMRGRGHDDAYGGHGYGSAVHAVLMCIAATITLLLLWPALLMLNLILWKQLRKKE